MINKKLISLLVAAFTLLGGLISRWHGGGFFKAPKILKNVLWALPFALAVGYFHIWFGIAAFALCWLGKTTGHGRGISLPEFLRGDPEKLEYLILWLKPSLTTHAYKHLILAVSGLLAVSGGVIGFSFTNPFAAVIIAVGGLLKGVAYEAGWKIYPDGTGDGLENFKESTQLGEFGAGIFAYGGLCIGFIISIL